jgi:hypothetical protein
MDGVVFLLILTVAASAVLALVPLLQADRREQERAGLFGAPSAARRAEQERSRAHTAAGRAAERDAAEVAVAATAARLAHARPPLRRIDEAERGWWLLGFADGTAMLVQARSRRTLRRLRRRIHALPVTLAGISRDGDLRRLRLEVVHRPLVVDALVVTVAR